MSIFIYLFTPRNCLVASYSVSTIAISKIEPALRKKELLEWKESKDILSSFILFLLLAGITDLWRSTITCHSPHLIHIEVICFSKPLIHIDLNMV